MGDLLDPLYIALPLELEEQLQELLIGAQKGSVKEISILARVCRSLPDPLAAGIHLIFLNHLNSSDVPTKSKSRVASVEEMRAFWSLWGLARLDKAFESNRRRDPYGKELVRAWPGVFKWSAYFYVFQVHDQETGKDHGTATPSQQSVVRVVLICAWCALSRSRAAKQAMRKTRGIGDIAARLWILGSDPDVTRLGGFTSCLSTAPCLQDIITNDGYQTAFTRLVTAAGGDAQKVAHITCRRLKKIVKSPRYTGEPVAGFMSFSFWVQLCLSKPEALEALLNQGAISVLIKFLHWIASVINNESYSSEERDLFVDLMKVAFLLVGRSLEITTGLPRVLEAIDSGLLTVFVECSPLYEDLTGDEYSSISSAIAITIPKYLAYFSVIQVTHKALLKLERTAQFRSLAKTRAWEAFNSLAKFTSWRLGVVERFKEMQKEMTICDNPKCHKSDVRSKFRKCARCGWAIYCSKECQTVHWKEFGHKKVCFESGTWNGLREGITLRDWEFIQSLNICETRYNLPYLKRLASIEHPGVPLDKLSIVIDYTTVPTSYHLTPNSTWKNEASKATTCEIDHCCHDAMVNVGTRVVGLVPHSGIKGPRLYPSPCRDSDPIWELDQCLTMEETETRLDPGGNKIIDWMSEEADERANLYCGI